MSSDFHIHYQKLNSFFEGPLHGVYIGVSNQKEFVICPYAQRMAIPNEFIFKVPDDELFDDALDDAHPEHIKGKTGVVRSMYGALHFDVETAKLLIETLTNALDTLEDS